MKKRIIPWISWNQEIDALLVEKAEAYENHGADMICVYGFGQEEKIRDEFLLSVKTMIKSIDLPVLVGISAKRFEDVKKAFYTGAKCVILEYATLPGLELVKEAVKRFGNEQIIVDLGNAGSEEVLSSLADAGICKAVSADPVALQKVSRAETLQILSAMNDFSVSSCAAALSGVNVSGALIADLPVESVMLTKRELRDKGIDVNSYESELEFGQFKLDSNGLIPAIVQDYKTNEVLMMGYMNETSYQQTIQTGCMTYFSRSRQKLWVKGETSGHYQYVKELKIDCDRDTILAKVKQAGAACHTGHYSCFYTDLMKKEYESKNSFAIFEEVYQVIMDRKLHPKEGSYTNYLFDKGIDKILKKCGEEATEIVIAAKNPEKEELKYEISDFLYHCMVLMVERGIDWEDITQELSNRH